MKNNKILAAVLAACLCAPAFAQSDKTMESMGFSRIVRDPAAAAMGFAAKASDASPAWAAFGNPGLIPMTSTRFAAGVSYQSWAPKAVKTGNLAAGVAYHPGRVGLTVGFAHQSGEAYEVVNNYGVSEGTYKPSDMIIGAGLGVQIVPSFSLGANVRFLSSNVSADDKYTSIGVDFLATWSQNGITVAGGVSNLGGSVSDSKKTSFSIPGSATLAAQYKAVFEKVHTLRADLDADWFFSSGSLGVAAGLEYGYDDLVFIRAGYHYGTELCVLPSFVTLGAGVKYMGIRFDLAYLTGNEYIGNTLTLGLGYSF